MGARPLIDFMKNNRPKEELEDENNEHLDNENQESENQEEKKVSPEEAVEAFKQEFARKLKWTSKEEWTQAGRDPDQWRDYNEFLESSPTYFEHLRKKVRDQENRMKRTSAAAAAALEDERRRGREEAEREAREAAQAGDPERAAAAVAKAAQAGPPPETVAWIAKNPWFNEDPEARALATTVASRLASEGKSNAEQLEAAEARVRKLFPEYFNNDDLDELPEFITRQPQRQQEEPRREVKMSESKVAQQAAAPSQSARVRESRVSNKEKTFKDIPAADQAQYEKYFARKFQGRGMKPEEAREKYAKGYWSAKD